SPPQGYKHSPTIAQATLAEMVSLPQEVKLYQYIDDTLVGGTSPERVGNAVIPPDTLRKIKELQMPPSRKELQQLMGTLGYWRKHV
ncbi:hypothetical protein FQV22_0012995, partial [Spheniscus magellanicus]